MDIFTVQMKAWRTSRSRYADQRAYDSSSSLGREGLRLPRLRSVNVVYDSERYRNERSDTESTYTIDNDYVYILR